jgi:hypothetical protein
VSHQISPQHPAVVLRSHYVHLRALLAVAMVAVVGLTGAVVILAIDDSGGSVAATTTPVSAPALPTVPGLRYDGGPDEGTRGRHTQAITPGGGVRYDGGPEEGGSAVRPGVVTTPPAGVRYDGGPDEGTTGLGH